ncbi:MAG: P-loop NTPase fold protein [Planctomycetota bacterium]
MQEQRPVEKQFQQKQTVEHEPNAIEPGSWRTERKARATKKQPVIPPGRVEKIGSVGSAEVFVRRATKTIEFENPNEVWVVPTDHEFNLDGFIAKQVFRYYSPNALATMRSSLWKEVQSRNKRGFSFEFVASAQHEVDDGQNYFFATAYSELGEVTLQNVAVATRAIVSSQYLSGKETVNIPLLGAGQGILPADKVTETTVRAVLASQPQTSLKKIVIHVPDAICFMAARDAAKAGGAPIDARAQRVYNDTPEGDDKLRIKTEIDALAEMLLLRNVQPPLVVGILGGWGSGKSFVMHLMERRMLEIRSLMIEENRAWPLTQKQIDAGAKATDLSPYIGHIYPIHFDAWTFAKADLWSSLMQKIFSELDEQLRLESQIQNLKNEDKPLSLLDTGPLWTQLIAFDAERRKPILESAIGKDALERYFKNPVADGLWEAFRNAKYSKLKDLENVKKEIVDLTKKENDARALADKAKEEALIKSAANVEQAELAAGAKRKAAAEAQKKAEQEFSDYYNQKVKDAGINQLKTEANKIGESALAAIKQKLNLDKDHPLSDPRAAQVELSTLWQQIVWLWETRQFLYLIIPIVALSAVVGPAFLDWMKDFQVPGAVLGGIGIIGNYWAAFMKHKKGVQDATQSVINHINKVKADLDAERDHWIAKKTSDLVVNVSLPPVPEVAAAAQNKILALEKDADDFKKQREKEVAAATKMETELGEIAQLSSIADLLKSRITNKTYEEKLGLLHQVQGDIRDLSESLILLERDVYEDAKRMRFPRGPARVVLFIDDLDRCPPDSVVKVLEAAQLLVKTPLFVVVIAMDLRYVTRALEREYKDILVRNGDPSGLDYLEKIIQIPYRVRPVRANAVDGFLESQMEVAPEEPEAEADANATKPAGSKKQDGVATNAKDKGNNDKENKDGEKENVKTADGDRNTTDKGGKPPMSPLPAAELKFEAWEANFLRECLAETELTPRSIKRIVNVLKLMKIVWHRATPIEEECEKIAIWLLVMSAEHPVEVNHIIEQFIKKLPTPVGENAAVPARFSHDDPAGQQSICDFITDTKEQFRSGGNEANWQDLDDSSRLLLEDYLLSDLDERTVDLIRSFSFIGSIGRDLTITAVANGGGLAPIAPPIPPQLEQSGFDMNENDRGQQLA